MDIKAVKQNLNKLVVYRDKQDTYKLTACIIRKQENKYFYQVELLDTKHGNSVMICRLEDINAVN